MHETHFLLTQHWPTNFLKKEAEDGGPVTVGKLRKWIDQPLAMGLPREVQNLIMLVVAAQTNRSFFLHGGPFNASVDNLTDDLELREQALPSKSDWEVATKRAATIFGVTSSPLVSAANVASLIAAVKTRASDAKTSCDSLCEKLQQMLPSLLSDGLSAPRYRTAVAAKALIDAIKQSSDGQIISALINAEIASSESAMGTSISRAATVVEALSQVNWDLLEAVKKLKGASAEAGNAIWRTLRESLQKDEYAVPISSVLKDVQSRATGLLVEAAAPPQTPPTAPPVVPPSAPPVPTGRTVLSQGSYDKVSRDDFSAVVDEIYREFDSDQDSILSISWEIYKK
jgi:hypothetical protein